MENVHELIGNLEMKMKNENEILNLIKDLYCDLSKLLPIENSTKKNLNSILTSFSQDESEIVRFNVGGSLFYTMKSTIYKKFKDLNGQFHESNLLEEISEKTPNKTEIPFIDHSPVYFNYILDYLRCPENEIELIDDKYLFNKLLNEAKYFKVFGLSQRLHEIAALDYLEQSFLSKFQFLDLLKLCNFDTKIKWKRLYKATIDGFSGDKFHEKCDGLANTLCIIQSEHGNVLGGFTTQPWSKKGGYLTDPDAFIFSLINKIKPVKFNCTDSNHAINCSGSLKFGFYNKPEDGHDIYISFESNKNHWSHCNVGHSYRIQDIDLNYGTQNARSLFAGSKKFRTTEIEVFYQQN